MLSFYILYYPNFLVSIHCTQLSLIMLSPLISSSLAAFLLLFEVASSASLVRVPDFGSPVPATKVEMWIYVPDKVAPTPAIVMAVRHLSLSFFNSTKSANFFDSYMAVEGQQHSRNMKPRTTSKLRIQKAT